MKLRTVLVVVRDLGCTVLGFAGVIHQEWWGPVQIPLLIFYASLLSVPAAANLLALARYGQAVAGALAEAGTESGTRSVSDTAGGPSSPA